MLYVVPTPIGNLNDISLRALEILRSTELILAEDTRVSGRLLKHFEINKPMWPYHAHNEHGSIEKIIDKLRIGQDIALISDAGTPGISDPGYLIVKACIDANIAVECLPGPTALIPALVVSGLPTHRFYFEGFLPHKKGRQSRLAYLAGLSDTMILYESPHRINRTIRDLEVTLGADRTVCLCREISKMHEESIRGTLQEISDQLDQRPKLKGEIVLVVSGKSQKRS